MNNTLRIILKVLMINPFLLPTANYQQLTANSQ